MNALFHTLENSTWLQQIYFLTAVRFWFVRKFRIEGDTLN